MKFLQLNLFLFGTLFLNSAFADNATFKLQCTPCKETKRPIGITITRIDYNSDKAVVSENDKVIQTLLVFPTLPDERDEPYERFVEYVGDVGMSFSLKVEYSPRTPREVCNSKLKAPFLGEDNPEKLHCRIVSW